MKYFFILVLFILLLAGAAYLIYDFYKERWYIFKREGSHLYEVAFSEEELWRRLDGQMAEIEFPSKPLVVRWWRKLFSLRGVSVKDIKLE